MLAADLGLDVLEVCQSLFGIEGTVIHDELNCLCPNPKHEDAHPSCNINLTTGLWRCLSCGDHGDLITLGHRRLNKRRGVIKELLAPSNPQSRLAMAERRLKTLRDGSVRPQEAMKSRRARTERPWLPEDARSLLAYKAGPLDYLINRGFTPDTLQRWGVRFARRAAIATKAGSLDIHNVACIPLCDEQGRLHSWCYRATDMSPKWQRENCRYLYTYCAEDKPWIGIHLHRDVSEIVVTEGALDAMWLDQAGIPAVAIGGNQVSPAKVETLLRFRKIVVFCDNDEGGRTATHRLGELLWDRVPVGVARYRRGTSGLDPQELSSADLAWGVRHARTWQGWSLRRRMRA